MRVEEGERHPLATLIEGHQAGRSLFPFARLNHVPFVNLAPPKIDSRLHQQS